MSKIRERHEEIEEMRIATEDKGFLYQFYMLLYPASALVLISFSPFLTFPSSSVICFPGSASRIFTADKYVRVFTSVLTCINKLEIKRYIAIENW